VAEPDLELALQNEFQRATRECIAIGYHPTRFLQMLGEHGPIATTIELVMGNHEGFEKLWELRRLDLSVEAIILREPFRRLFSPEVLEQAEQKLRDVGYLLKLA
jgi:5-methylcytosine-specific restriction enzyme A